VIPGAITPGAEIPPSDVAHYATYGFSSWGFGPADDQGKKYDLMPAGYAGSANTARLLTYFTMSDIHITDKESPAEVPYFGWSAPNGAAGLFNQAYSPVMLSTTQVLNAAVKTINSLHNQTAFDFGMLLGDACNSSQYNELRWFIDVMDGKTITPSSGDHLGARSIDYQKPFKAAGLNGSIPWYACIGNHDEFWMGVNYPNAKLQNAMVGSEVLNIGPVLLAPNNSDATGVYVGVVDGTSNIGAVIKGGPEGTFPQPPTVVADPDRRSLTTSDPFSRNWVTEFFNSSSQPVGHGFNLTGSGSTFACYSFVPKSSLPIKVIVLDDTCKTIGGGGPAYYGSGWMDAERYAWLTNELQAGQDNDQLMILACHIPINPQLGLFDTTPNPQFYPASYKSDAEMIAMLHNYPNLILLMAGHRHLNTVTPQRSPIADHPEYGFWEVETPSLRDFPQQFRTFDIRRNVDNSISILTTSVDPAVTPGSPAGKSRGYAIGAARVYGLIDTDDYTSHTYNAELYKYLTPTMQAKIAGYGSAMGRSTAKAVSTKKTAIKSKK
jgi:metallophosphoesterase (TIGR03768 family)